jgi:hypothetical protein
MNLANVITMPLYEYEYQFVICESCFWCATVFHKSITIKQEQEEITIISNLFHEQKEIMILCI